MNERLIHFLGEMAGLLSTLQQRDLAGHMQVENIFTKRPSTMAKIDELLNEARELGQLYDDRPGNETYPSEN